MAARWPPRLLGTVDGQAGQDQRIGSRSINSCTCSSCLITDLRLDHRPRLLHQSKGRHLLDRGRQEGREEGEAQGEAKVTLRQLNRRCGPLSEVTTARIQALPLQQLEALSEALLDFTGPADLAVWLAEHAG